MTAMSMPTDGPFTRPKPLRPLHPLTLDGPFTRPKPLRHLYPLTLNGQFTRPKPLPPPHHSSTHPQCHLMLIESEHAEPVVQCRPQAIEDLEASQPLG